jgi:hypothetical protein
MSHNKISRLVSAVIWGVIAACAMHIHHARTMQMGREAFIARQGVLYDRVYTHPHSIFVEVIVCLFLLGIMFVAYELVAFVVLKILEKKP